MNRNTNYPNQNNASRPPRNGRPVQQASRRPAPSRPVKRGKKKMRLNFRGVVFLIMAAIFLFVLIWGIIKIVSVVRGPVETAQSVETNEDGTPVTSVIETEPSTTHVDADLFSNVFSNYIYLMDAEDGAEIGSLSGDDRFYPASITKIMTALIVLESGVDIESSYTIPYYVYDMIFNTDLAVVGIEKDEVVTVKDLLYGAMLRSGAECCLGLADCVSGSEEAFVELMNQKAVELGCTNTHFTNCTGSHDTEHYTTAHDMALIMRAALQNQTFRNIVSAPEYYIQPTDVHPDGITIYNTFFQNISSTDVGGATILGGKTGYTDQAGQSLVTYATINGHEYILVTMGAFAPANVYAGRLHTNDHSLIYARLAAYINGTPTPTVSIETIATTAPTLDSSAVTDESGNTITTTATTTVQTTVATSETTAQSYIGETITFGNID